MNRTILTLSAIAGASMGLIPACATTPSAPNRLASTTGTMGEIETLLDEGEAELNELIESMNALENAPDAARAYRDFDDNVEDIERIAERVRSRRITMQTRAAEYVARWRAESAGLSSDRAAEISLERSSQFESSVDAVGEELDQLRADYDPFISKLRDLRVVLENDLTSRGIEMSRPIRQDLAAMAEDLRGRSADAKAALADARTEFARPTTPENDSSGPST